jgi:sodium transport system ATP-binding protein
MTDGALNRRIDQLVDELEITSFADRPCRTLSSGQKQRANIARAFLHQPGVLLLDEPTAALDVISGRFLTEAIRRERASGRAVLVSTHIMSEAEYLCDRLYLLYDGRIADHGPLADLLSRSASSNLTDAFLHHAVQARRAGPACEG